MGMLKKAANLRQGYGRQASGSMPAEAASRRQVTLCRAHGQSVRSARQKGENAAGGFFQRSLLGLLDDFRTFRIDATGLTLNEFVAA